MKALNNIYNAIKSAPRVYVREMRNVFSDVGVMLFFFFLPLAYPVIYSLIYNPELVREVPVVVVDHDRTPLSREFTRRFGATQAPHIIGYAADLPEARKAIDAREAFAILEIPAGFDRKIHSGQQAPAIIYCEMSLLLRYRSLLFAATDLQTSMGAELLASNISNLGAESLAPSEDPMPIESVMLGNIQSGFDSFIMPAVLILILQQSIVLAVGMLGGSRNEKKGILAYNPVNTTGSLAVDLSTKAIAYITLLALPIIWLIHYVPLVFQFPMAGSTLEIFAFILPLVLASIALGYIIQLFTTERESIFIIWVATSVLFLFLSGITWPRYAMSPFWQLLSDIVPATWGVNGFVLMDTNGSTLAQVAPYYRNLWLLAGAYSLLAYLLQRLRKHARPAH